MRPIRNCELKDPVFLSDMHMALSSILFETHLQKKKKESFPTKRCAQEYFRSKEKVRVFEVQKMKNTLLQMRVSETV